MLEAKSETIPVISPEQVRSFFRTGVDHYNKEEFAEAFQNFSIADQYNYQPAAYFLGMMFEHGNGVIADPIIALQFYKKAAGLMLGEIALYHPEAQFDLGLSFLAQGNIAKAIEYFQPAAFAGHDGAQYQLGEIYYWGNGIAPDYFNAAYNYYFAANSGNNRAQVNFAYCLLFGIGTPQNPELALAYFHKAETDNLDANLYLGICYFLGEGAEVNLELAEHYFQLCATEGYRNCIYFLEDYPVENWRIPAVYAAAAQNLKQALAADLPASGFELSAPIKNPAIINSAVVEFKTTPQYKAPKISVHKYPALSFIKSAQQQEQHRLFLDQFIQSEINRHLDSVNLSISKKSAPNFNFFKTFLPRTAGDDQFYIALGHLKQNQLKQAESLFIQAAKKDHKAAQYFLVMGYIKGEQYTRANYWLEKFKEAPKKLNYSSMPSKQKPEAKLKDAIVINAATKASNLETKIEQKTSKTSNYQRKPLNLYGFTFSFADLTEENQFVEAFDNKESMANLGARYFFGNGVKKDFQKAVALFLSSAELGNVSTLYAVGVCYFKGGFGIEQNTETANIYFKKAKEYFISHISGRYLNPYSFQYLGKMYLHGYGVPQSYALAAKNLCRAAEHIQNDPELFHQIGFCYHKGGDGLPRNPETAQKWFKRAADLKTLQSNSTSSNTSLQPQPQHLAAPLTEKIEHKQSQNLPQPNTKKANTASSSKTTSPELDEILNTIRDAAAGLFPDAATSFRM